MSLSYLHFTGAINSSNSRCTEWKLNAAGTDYDLVGTADYNIFVPMFLEKIKSSSDSYLPGSMRPKGFFGKWLYKADPGSGRPQPIKLEKSVINRPANPRWKSRQHEGEIITSPMRATSIAIHCDPVPVNGSDTALGTDNVTQLDFPELAASIPFKGTKNYPILYGGKFYSLQINATVSRFTAAGWYLPSIDAQYLFDLWSQRPSIDNATVTKAMVKLNQETLDLLTELAELPETLALARDTLNLFAKKGARMRQLLKEARDVLGGEKSLRKLADRGAEIRLLYQYGILPLGYTLEDIKKVLKESFKRQYCKASSTFAGPSDFNKLAGFTFEGGSSNEEKVWLKRRLDPDSSFQQLQAVFGFNIPKTIWEITPWSLVVDWFVNVGDYLTAINVIPSLQEAGTYSVRRSISGTYRQVDKPDVVIRVEFQHYDRFIINPTDHICLSFDPLITGDRALNALAFSWQIISKNIRKLRL